MEQLLQERADRRYFTGEISDTDHNFGRDQGRYYHVLAHRRQTALYQY